MSGGIAVRVIGGVSGGERLCSVRGVRGLREGGGAACFAAPGAWGVAITTAG
ncbi:MAG: hypothetical protein HQL57_10045 [Magnetococcales bacterium]|nr:hypothetical protein [Magnetococcales bacterium]MBF0157512.1 hypothetical protein [Magnetococcales bacterium]